MTEPIIFNDVSRRLTLDGDTAIIRRQQEIPADFFDRAAELKHIQDSAPAGEFLQVATIPANVVEEWYAQGFNIFDKNVNHTEILRRLRNEDKDKLITTSRSI